MVRRRIRKNLEFSPHSFVCSFVLSVYLSALAFLEIRSLLFSETLQLVRACKGEKNVPSAFLKKISCFGQKLSKMGHFWPKCPKMEVFYIFLGIPSLLFSEHLQLIRAFNSEKNIPKAFLKKNPVSPILAKNCSKLAIFGQNAQKWRFFSFFSVSLHYLFLKICS